MILQRLRDETRPSHERIEAHIDLLGRAWSLPFYQILLQKFYGFYAAIEPSLWARPEWPQVGIETSKRQKTELLRRDLKYFAWSETAINSLPHCAKAPVTANFAQALGCAYVLEGSTLGGQIITRHLRGQLGIQAAQGGCFFASYGEQVGPMWRDFVAVLNSFEGSQAEQNELVACAGATFDAFDDWLSDIL